MTSVSRASKVDHFAKAVAFNLQNDRGLGLKVKLPKTCDKRLYKHTAVVLCKEWLEKEANIRKMTRFLKVAKLAILQRL